MEKHCPLNKNRGQGVISPTFNQFKREGDKQAKQGHKYK